MPIKGIKIILNIFASIVLLLFVVFIFTLTHNPDRGNISPNNIKSILPFSLSDNDITYNIKADPNISKTKTDSSDLSEVLREEILNRAKAMTEVKWTPMYNLIGKKCFYIFIKGKTYHGVPYSMDPYQVTSPNDFLSKINNSKILYGNDCSGFVSAAWGLSRQTTLSLYNAVKDGSKIDGKSVCQISWDDLKPADALLIDNGKGKGHVMLYIDSDKKNSDNLNLYEQDISTVIPFEPIPAARRDVRSKSKLMKNGYIPIRLMANTLN